MPLHCVSKLAWILGLAALLTLQLADGRRHNLRSLHRARHLSSDAALPGDPEDRPPARHPRREENYEGQEDEDEEQAVEYRNEDSFDGDGSAEYQEIQRVPSRHRLTGRKVRAGRHRQHRLPVDDEDPMNLAREQPTREHRPRGKRLTQRRHWTDKDREAFDRRPLPLDHDRRDYELEVREAQNSSLCNYTVIPIPDPGGRIPRELEHVRCNHAGSRCQELGTYCCIQLYRYVEVAYEAGGNEKIKVYSGCVCSLQIYGTLEPYTPELEINY